MKLIRSYIHRTLGKMHEPVTFELYAMPTPDGEPIVVLTMDGHALPDVSIESYFQHGSQTLQDPYAGKTLADGIAACATRYMKLITGDVSIKGTGVDTLTTICRQLCRAWFKSDCANPDTDTTPELWKTFAAKKTKDQAVVLDAIIDSNRDVFEKQAKKVMKEKKKTLEVTVDVTTLM